VVKKNKLKKIKIKLLMLFIRLCGVVML